LQRHSRQSTCARRKNHQKEHNRKKIVLMADGADKIEHHSTGHRARLRKRLFEQQGESLHDHELVEYLLALAIPRRDTKQIAKDLIARYGSFSALLTADAESIMREKWMGETSVAALKIVQVAALRLLSEPVREMPVLSSWQALLDYLRADMAHLTIERVRTLYLNSISQQQKYADPR
jgi:DNA repair protein RadC